MRSASLLLKNVRKLLFDDWPSSSSSLTGDSEELAPPRLPLPSIPSKGDGDSLSPVLGLLGPGEEKIVDSDSASELLLRTESADIGRDPALIGRSFRSGVAGS